MPIASDLIQGSLRLIGQLAEGETASVETLNDALVAFNQMLDSWSIERLSVYATETSTQVWQPGVASYTLGPTGTFVGDRPIMVDDATYFVDPASGISYPIRHVNQQQYNSISIKNLASSYPLYLWVNMTEPNITLTVFPVPSLTLNFNIVSVLPLTQATTLATELVFPPGYLRAFRFCLACELAAEFGVDPSSTVVALALASKRNIKRVNNPNNLLAMPYPLMPRRGRYNIYTDSI